MKIRRFGPFRAVGAYVRTSHAKESSTETGLISDLRFRFFERYVGGLIHCKIDRCEFLEIFTDYESDEYGGFTFFKGHRVSHIIDLHEEMIAIEVPRRKYAVFTVDPDADEGIEETEQAILRFFEESTSYQRAYTTDLIISDGIRCKYYVSIR